MGGTLGHIGRNMAQRGDGTWTGPLNLASKTTERVAKSFTPSRRGPLRRLPQQALFKAGGWPLIGFSVGGLLAVFLAAFALYWALSRKIPFNRFVVDYKGLFSDEPCHVLLTGFAQGSTSSFLFGKGYSSDYTGDGPPVKDNSINHALEQLRGGGNNGFRNKKVDYQKPKSGGRSDPDDMSEKSEGKRQHPAKVRSEKKEKEQKEQDKLLVVRPLRPTMYGVFRGWDGQQPYHFVLEGTVWRAIGLVDGNVADVVHEGQLVVNVKTSKPGFLLTHSESEKKCSAIPAFVTYAFGQEFTVEGKTYAPTSFDVFVPFLDFLRAKVSTPLCTDTHRNMAMASANRHFGCVLDHDILVATYNYYVHYNQFRIFRLQTGFGRVCVDDRDRAVDCEMVRYGEVHFDGDIGRHVSVDCHVGESYPFRPDCALLFFKEEAGVKVNAHRMVGGMVPVLNHHFGLHQRFLGCLTQWEVGPQLPDPSNAQAVSPSVYPRFQTSEDGANGSKYYRSIYTGFYPVDATPFLMYSVNALNATKALKRMCGARESLAFDEDLTSLQYSAFAHLFFSTELDWVGAREELAFGRDWTWRSRFNTVANLEFTSGHHLGKLYDWVQVGNLVKLRKLNEHRKGLKPLKPITYTCPVAMREGWFGSSERISGGPIAAWFGKHSSLTRIYAQMRVGFSDLLESFSRTTLDQYAASHPKWIYGTNYENFTTFLDYRVSREELAIIPHIKRALRHMFVARVVEHTPDDNMTRFVEAKVKKEFAKQGKVPRLYVTYDGGCMFANELPEYAKVCLDGCRTYSHNGVKVHINIFAKPTTPGLTESLRSAINCMSRHDEVYILIYSDDSVWAGNLNGHDFAFNVDISSCDSGNKSGVFGLIFMLLSQFSPELAIGLVSQCANVIKLANPENGEEKCEIHMFSLFEGSGTVLTTILNHVAMFMIAQAAVIILGDNKDRINHWEKISELVVKCGEAFGHVLTVEPARNDYGFVPEKIQFLKRSPLRLTTGEYIPVMNYGTIFRGFGSIEGDLTADMVGMSVVEFAQLSVGQRMDVFLSGVVAGLKNEPNSIILSALRRRFCCLPGSLASGWENLDHVRFSSQSSNVLDGGSVDHAKGMVCTESLSRRYDVSTSQLDALAGKISNCRVGYMYPDECVGSFARVDYGCGHV